MYEIIDDRIVRIDNRENPNGNCHGFTQETLISPPIRFIFNCIGQMMQYPLWWMAYFSLAARNQGCADDSQIALLTVALYAVHIARMRAPNAFTRILSERRRRRSRWLVNFVSLVYNWCQTVFTVLYSALRYGDNFKFSSTALLRRCADVRECTCQTHLHYFTLCDSEISNACNYSIM